MKSLLTTLVLGGILLATAVTSFIVFREVGDVDISIHGMIALILGVILTLGLGVGLMYLVFYSSRRGYDDAHHENDHD